MMSPPRTLTLRLLVLPVCQALLLPSLLPPPFPIKVELLDKSGERKTVHTELAPHFSSSRVLHVRFELPVSLHVEPHKGVMQISKDGGGLHRGDVLRAPPHVIETLLTLAILAVASCWALPLL